MQGFDNVSFLNFPVTTTMPPVTTGMPTFSTTISPTFTTPKPCIPPQIPSVCAPVCEEKCHFLGKCDTIIGSAGSMCFPGCVCPNGTIWDGVTCVVPDQCPCKDEQGNLRPVNSFLLYSFRCIM